MILRRRAAGLVAVVVMTGCGAGEVDDKGGAATTSPTTSTAAPASGLQLTQTCEAVRYRVRYPTGWSTNGGEVAPPCRYFDPEPFTVPPATEVLDLAVIFDVEAAPFARLAEAAGGPEEEILEQRELRIDGHRAVRVEARATGDGLVPAGAPTLRYLVDLDGSTLLATTFGLAGVDHDRNRDVLDAMVATLAVKAGTGCSAADLPSEPTPQDLPEPVAETRRSIVAAATACDFDLLAEVAEAGATFTYSFGDSGDPAAHWRREEADGDPLRVLVELLNRPSGRRSGGGEAQYVWPRAYAYDTWDEVQPDARAELEPIYGPEDFENFARFGSYSGYRAGISAEGDWLFYVAGD